MICNNCGTQNNEGAKFCIRCGNMLINSQNLANENNIMQNSATNFETNNINNMMTSTSINQENLQQQNNYINQQPMQQPINGQVQFENSKSDNVAKITIGEAFKLIVAIILKPFTAFKEENKKFENFSNSLIVSIIISVVVTLISLLKTMYETVKVTSYFSDSKYNFENLKNIEYFKEISSNLLIYLGVIFGIAIVYYLASLVIKKQVSFSKILGISAIAIVPFALGNLILSPLLGLINEDLPIIAYIIGGIYTLIIMYEGINEELQLTGNVKYYLNLICMSIIAIAIYYIIMNILSESISSFGGLFGM